MAEELTADTIKITVGAEEKIGLANYSNVVVGPIIISRVIETGDNEYIEAQIKENLALIEKIISEARDDVLESVQESKK